MYLYKKVLLTISKLWCEWISQFYVRTVGLGNTNGSFVAILDNGQTYNSTLLNTNKYRF